ncbi:MAG: type II toxin-antitoxin system Phd/YefM family antitoxin [Firmicutes bacterium]|nr:type II toxin-antitoxin system Phd/YefM family antitoxin [Bacillota bacterium]
MSIVNATNFRKNAYDFLANAVNLSEVVTITTKNGNAVLLSEEDYRGLAETAYLNSIPGLANDIIAGMNTPTEELVEIDWKNELQD